MEFMRSGTATLGGLENNQVATSRYGEPHVKAPALLPKFAKQVFLATLLIEDYESHLWQCCDGNARAHRAVQKANIVDREFQERGDRRQIAQFRAIEAGAIDGEDIPVSEGHGAAARSKSQRHVRSDARPGQKK